MTVTIDILSRYLGTKGFKLAKKDLNAFERGVKNVGKSLASVFAAREVYNFAKSAGKAFMEDDKAAKLLSKSLDNLSLGFAKQDVANYVANLEKVSAVADDYLRPALQQLLTVTNNVAKSEGLLSTALNVSAGTGKDLQTVTMALSKAYLGNRTALGKLGVPLTKAQLQTMSLVEIQKELNKVYKGAASAAAETYQGKVDALKISIDNFKESVGKGLFDALTSAGGQQGFKQTTSLMDTLAGKINNVTNAVGILLGQANMYLSGSSYSEVQAFKNERYNELMRSRQQYGGAAAEKYKAEAQKAADKKAAENAKKQLAAQQALLKTQKDALKQKKLGYIMDMNQIEIVAALQKEKDEAVKKRLEIQLALLQDNTDVAAKLASQLAALEPQNTALANFLQYGLPDAKNPFEAWDLWLKGFEGKLANVVTKMPPAASSTFTPSDWWARTDAQVAALTPSQEAADAAQAALDAIAALNTANSTANNAEIKVQLMLDSQVLADAVVNTTQSYTANGGRTGVNRLQYLE